MTQLNNYVNIQKEKEKMKLLLLLLLATSCASHENKTIEDEPIYRPVRDYK